MVSIRSIPSTPSSLTPGDLPWIIEHREDRCTLCGRCTAVCPVYAIKLTYMRQRMPRLVLTSSERGAANCGLTSGTTVMMRQSGRR